MTTLPGKVVSIAAALLLCAGAASAQQDSTMRIDARWRGYVGCWAASTVAVPVGPTVCVVPTSDAQTVEFVTIAGDSIVSTIPLSASVTRVERSRAGCKGWETAQWSADERRLYSRAEYTCADGSTQKQQSMISMRYADTFTRIDGIRAGEGFLTRVAHFQAMTPPYAVPEAIQGRLPAPPDMPTFNARLAAAADISLADIVDATKSLESPIVEAWIADRGQRFSASANELRALKQSGVSEGVIDMVVAVSNPRYFTLAQSGSPMARPADPFAKRPAAAGTLSQADLERLRFQREFDARYGNGLDWWNGYFGWSPYGYNYSRFGGFYSNFGGAYSGFSPYWWNFPNYGGNFGGGGWVSGTPVVIVPTNPEPPGRVINGLGYTQGSGSSTGRGAEPRSPSVGTWDGGSSMGSGGGGVSTSSGGGGGSAPAGGGEQRTAKPRP